MFKIKHLPPPQVRNLRAGIVVLACSMMLAACQKEETGTVSTISLFAEDFHGGDAKMGAMWTDRSFSWQTGDEVRINNNGTFGVSTSSTGHTITTTGDAFTTPLRALSPASLYDGDLTSDQVQVTLPDTYQWSTFIQNNNTYQKLDIPMAAYSTSGNQLDFKHLCGVLAVQINNNTGATICVEEIVVYNNRYMLSGTRWIDFSDLANFQPEEGGTQQSKRVTMRFDNEDLLISPNSPSNYNVVMVPVLPVGDNTNATFTVQVKYRTHGEESVTPANKPCFTFTQKQASGRDNSLGRAQCGFAPIDAVTSGPGSSSTANPRLQKDHFFQDDDNYYLIKDQYQLKHLIELGDGNTCSNIRIAKDIDMGQYTLYTSIYNVQNLDGAGHTISNLNFSGNGAALGLLCARSDYVEPFQLQVHDLNLSRCDMTVGPNSLYVGALVAKTSARGVKIERCKVSDLYIHGILNQTYDAEVCIGGLVGHARGNDTRIYGSTVEKLGLDYNESVSYYQVKFGGFIGSLSGDVVFGTGSFDDTLRIWFYRYYNNSNATQSVLKAQNNVYFGGLVGAASGEIRFNRLCMIINGSGYGYNWKVISTGSDVYVGKLIGMLTNCSTNYLDAPGNLHQQLLSNVAQDLNVYVSNTGTIYKGDRGNFDWTPSYMNGIVGNSYTSTNPQYSGYSVVPYLINNNTIGVTGYPGTILPIITHTL